MWCIRNLRTLSKTCFRRQVTNNRAIAVDFKPVYSFRFIKSFAVINKLKFYQTAATCITIPCGFAMSVADICSHDLFAGIVAIGVSGCMVLHTLGYFTANTVGILYLHNSGEKTKISYLDKWGARRDEIVDTADIIPFSEQPRSITDPLYLHLLRYSSKQKLKFHVRYGEVLDAQCLRRIFITMQ